jgi:hypothetical protein
VTDFDKILEDARKWRETHVDEPLTVAPEYPLPAEPVRVVYLVRPCVACPAQWAGMTNKAEPVYARFRGGEGDVRIGEPGWPMDLVEWPGEGRYVVEWTGFHMWAGTFAQLADITRGFVEWPEGYAEPEVET